MKNSLKQTICFLLMVAIFSCTKTESDTLGGIYGTITDSYLREPVQGALVTLSPSGKSMTTGSDGSYEFNGLEVGSYSLTVSKNKYGTDTKTVNVTPGSNSKADFSVQTANGSIELSKHILDFGSANDMLAFDIKNIGKNDLTFTINNPYANWLTINPYNRKIASNRIQPVTVTLDRQYLEESKSVKIPISSNAGSAEIEIKATNANGPVIELSKTSLDFGENLSSLSFDISNKGKTNLTYAIAQSEPWLSATPSTGNLSPLELKTVIININRNKLSSSGTYLLAIQSNAGSKEISLSVEKPLTTGKLQISPDLLNFGTGTSSLNLVLSNTGTAALEYTIASPEDWLSFSRTSGTILPSATTTITTTITATIDRNKFNRSKESTVQINSTGGSRTFIVKAEKLVNFGTVTSCSRKIDLKITGVEKNGNTVFIAFTLKNNGPGFNNGFDFGGQTDTYATDNLGTYYSNTKSPYDYVTLKLGDQTADYKWKRIIIPQGVLVGGEVQIKNVPTWATSFPIIKFYTRSYTSGVSLDQNYVEFKDVPIL